MSIKTARRVEYAQDPIRRGVAMGRLTVADRFRPPLLTKMLAQIYQIRI